MATGLGFCANCGTPRTAAEQQFCPTCGTTLPAMAVPAAVSVPPAAPPYQAATQYQAATPPPPPPAWGAPPAQGGMPNYSMNAPVMAPPAKSSISPAMILAGLILIAAIAGGAYLFTNNNKSSGVGSTGSANPVATMTPANTGNNGGTTPTTVPANTGNNGGTTPTTAPGATSADNGGSGLSGAASALSSISSYKFKMTLAGGEFGSMLSELGGSSASGNAPVTISGTIEVTPDKGADITMAGFHIIEIGGFDYLDMSGTGSFLKTAATGTSMADSFSPATMFSSFVGESTDSGFTKVGSENKNGVQADHYQASAAALAEFGSASGVEGATWSADIWVAQNGGYPVSMSILGKAADNSVAYEIQFDITNVNAPANKITAPTNVTGA